MDKLFVRLLVVLCFVNIVVTQGQNNISDRYIDSIELGIKKGIYKKMQAKMNCFEQWQRLYVDASGKVVKAVGGTPQDCYMMEKTLYLQQDSMVYYIESFKPNKGSADCKDLSPQSFGYGQKDGKLLVMDLYKKTPVVAEEPEATLQSIKGLYRAIYRDFNSICYRGATVVEKHIQNVNALVIAGKVKAVVVINSDDSLGQVIAYKHEGELVMLKTKYAKDSVFKSFNMYFLKGELVDYSFNHEVVSDSLPQLMYADRFQIEEGHIKNFNLLEIVNPKYMHRPEADIVKELSSYANDLKKKYGL